MQGNQKAAFGAAEQHLGETKNRAQVYQIMGQLKLKSVIENC